MSRARAAGSGGPGLDIRGPGVPACVSRRGPQGSNARNGLAALNDPALPSVTAWSYRPGVRLDRLIVTRERDGRRLLSSVLRSHDETHHPTHSPPDPCPRHRVGGVGHLGDGRLSGRVRCRQAHRQLHPELELGLWLRGGLHDHQRHLVRDLGLGRRLRPARRAADGQLLECPGDRVGHPVHLHQPELQRHSPRGRHGELRVHRHGRLLPARRLHY